jgi:hypothetical protein
MDSFINLIKMDWELLLKTNLSMSFVLAIVVAFLLLLLYIWHRDSHSRIDLKDLICKEGHLDEKKFTRFGAWIVSTWGFVYMILDDQFTEWYFLGYMTVWTGNAIFDKYLSRGQTQQPAHPAKP